MTDWRTIGPVHKAKYTVSTPIIGPATGTLAEALGWLDIKACAETEYATELWRLCALVGIDPAVLFAQWAHETGDGSSGWWHYRKNPAGIGVTGDPDQDNESQVFTSGSNAARGHVAHMIAYTYQNLLWPSVISNFPNWTGDNGQTETYLGTRPLWAEDHRFYHAVQEIHGTVRTLSDLTGKWAVDPRYAEKIAAKANAIFPNRQEVQPMTTPQLFNLETDYARYGLTNDEAREVLSHRFDNRNGMKPQFIVLHIQAGYTRGSLEYWANTAQASSTVMIQHDGSILNVIPEQHGPWTNGDDANPSANGARLVNLPGNSNLYTLSIEAEGVDGSDTTPAQLDSIVWQVETWMVKYGIPKANILRHADINSVTRPNCPGAYYPKVMARIGETPTGPQYATPLPITWKAGDLGWEKLGDVSVYCLEAEVEVVRATTPLAWADGDKSDGEKAPNAGPKIKQGERVKVIGSFVNLNEKGQTVRWLIRASDNARIIGSSCRPLLPFKQ